MVRARFTDCSTRMTVVPCARMAAIMGSSCSTMTGARPSESSSMSSSRGRPRKAMPSASICCWPPDRLRRARPAGRPGPGTDPAPAATRCRAWRSAFVRSSQPATRRFSRTVSVGNTRWPPGTRPMPSAAISLGGGVGDVPPVEDDGTLVGLDHAADRLQQGRLAGAVGAEQGHDLALVDLKIDVEEHLHLAVVHLQAPAQHQLDPTLAALGEEDLGAGGGQVRTWVMSRSMTRPAVERIRPPIRNTGTMISMPIRMPTLSAMAPTMGRTINPGITQMAPMEKPRDLDAGRDGQARASRRCRRRWRPARP